MQRPPVMVLAVMALVVAVLTTAHLVATEGTGNLGKAELEMLAVTPASALDLTPHLLWAGLFHFSWQHLGYNLVLFALAFPLATRRAGPWTTLALSMLVALAASLALPALVIRPLAGLGIAYAADALDNHLVGASIGIYAIAGAALAHMRDRRVAIAIVAVGVAAEAVAAVVGTRPFVFAYHLAGLGLGYGGRWLLDRARTASVRISPAPQSSSRLRRALAGLRGQSTHLGSASQQASSRSLGASGGQGMGWDGDGRAGRGPAPRSAVLLQDQPAARRLGAGHVADAVDDRVEV